MASKYEKVSTSGFDDDLEGGNGGSAANPDPAADIQGRIMSSMFTSALDAGRARMQSAGFGAASIDVFRPYFDVDSKDVVKRLLSSLIPNQASPLVQKYDLYGPLMLCFTLSAVLELGMKLTHTTLLEGTLVGTSLAIVFSYWGFTTLMAYVFVFLFEMKIKLMHVASIQGYSLFGYVLALLTGYLATSPALFYVAFLLFGGSSAAAMGMVYYEHSAVKQRGIITGGAMAGVHILFLLYLRNVYVYVAEAI